MSLACKGFTLNLVTPFFSSDTESDDTLEEEKDEEEEEEDEEPVTPSPESSADKETGAMALTSIIDVDPRR